MNRDNYRPETLLLKGHDLYEMAKQRADWELSERPRKYRLANPESPSQPVRDLDLDEGFDALLEGLEMQLSEYLEKDYSVTSIESPIDRSGNGWKRYELRLRSNESLLDYKAMPAVHERVSEPEELKQADTRINLKGGGIGEQIWENTPVDMRPESFEEDGNQVRAQWTVR